MIEVRDVVQRFGEVSLPLPDVNLAKGESLLVKGPSGSGKTTLLHLLAGLRVASQGLIEVDGNNLARLSEAARDRFRAERVGYIFQDFYLQDGYTALENVLLGLGIAGLRGSSAMRRAREVLEQVGLGQRLHHIPRRLSTGERQRLALARAIAHRPRLLLADEPTAHLDRKRAKATLTLLTETAQSVGATLIVATHDPLVMQAFPRQVEVG
jgi:putative ABC transport system ATP-binding protein